MTVIELIRALRKVDNKGREVWIDTPAGRIQLSEDRLKDEYREPLIVREEADE